MQIESCALQIMVVTDTDRNPTRTQAQPYWYAQNVSHTMLRPQRRNDDFIIDNPSIHQSR